MSRKPAKKHDRKSPVRRKAVKPLAELWEKALEIAGGEEGRIQVVARDNLVVWNHATWKA